MAIAKQQVIDSLKQVIFFAKQNNIVDLNMVDDLVVGEKEISLTVIFPKLEDPSVNIVYNSVVKTLKDAFGSDMTINVKPVAEKDRGLGPLSGVKNIIAVIAGKGGVGKSTVAANLAVSLAREGYSVGILDADIMGPSVPILFGVEGEQPGVIERSGKTYMVPLEKFGVRILSLGFFVQPNQALMWRGSMINNAFNQLMKDAEWGNLDFLVIDMPPGTGDIQLTLGQSYNVRGTVLVTTPQRVATADVRRAAIMCRQDKLTIPLLGIVENMSYFIPEDAPDKKYSIFGQGQTELLAEELGIPILAKIPIVGKIAESGDNGDPIALDLTSPVAQTFRTLVQNLKQELEKE
ncbi:MAG: Mrp/NBP35 family ATP-binding protein [Bacteroidales bacterium]|nr:Mrp/NBP35 family ATP-binding protein [Bacteroidales bacterium]